MLILCVGPIVIAKKHSTGNIPDKDVCREFLNDKDEIKAKQKKRDEDVAKGHIQLLMIKTEDEAAEAKKKEKIEEWLENIEIRNKSEQPEGELITVSSNLNSLLNDTLVLRLAE